MSSLIDSLHHGQVFEGLATVLLSFISRPQELDLALFGLDFIEVLLDFLLSGDVGVGHRLARQKPRRLTCSI